MHRGVSAGSNEEGLFPGLTFEGVFPLDELPVEVAARTAEIDRLVGTLDVIGTLSSMNSGASA